MPSEATRARPRADRYRDILVLSLVPALVGTLILVSWALAHWRIGSPLVSAGLALGAMLLGGFPRFIAGFKDLYRRKSTH